MPCVLFYSSFFSFSCIVLLCFDLYIPLPSGHLHWPSQSPKLLSLALSLTLHPTTGLFLQSTPWRNCLCNYTLCLCSHSIYLSLVFNPPHIPLKQLSPKLLNDFLVAKSNGYILVSILSEQFPCYFSPGFLSFVCPFLRVLFPQLMPACR